MIKALPQRTTVSTDLFSSSYARFSEDKKHRIYLSRVWSHNKPTAMVIGLNPSSADAVDDDPTIGFVKRVLNFNGFGGLHMVNLFTMISTDPDLLIMDDDPTSNMGVWMSTAQKAKAVVFAWGGFKTHGRDKLAIELFPDALCFGHLKNGAPRHPMYLPEATQLKHYNKSISQP